ncbi:MAG TPA: hypothetical protein VGD67_21780 [Pseudonocardiaceae bacterium]
MAMPIIHHPDERVVAESPVGEREPMSRDLFEQIYANLGWHLVDDSPSAESPTETTRPFTDERRELERHLEVVDGLFTPVQRSRSLVDVLGLRERPFVPVPVACADCTQVGGCQCAAVYAASTAEGGDPFAWAYRVAAVDTLRERGVPVSEVLIAVELAQLELDAVTSRVGA